MTRDREMIAFAAREGSRMHRHAPGLISPDTGNRDALIAVAARCFRTMLERSAFIDAFAAAAARNQPKRSDEESENHVPA